WGRISSCRPVFNRPPTSVRLDWWRPVANRPAGYNPAPLVQPLISYNACRMLLLVLLLLAPALHAQSVTVQVDAAKSLGPLRPIWRYFGYDEPNFTYMPDGKKLLAELSALSSRTV